MSDDNLSQSVRGVEYIPVTFERCDHISGPFFHGTKVALAAGALLVPGQPSNYHSGRMSNHVYFAASLEPAIWAAELANVLTGSDERGHVYAVEPTGPFEDDPNVTNKRFPGNITQSYRTAHPLRIVREVVDWDGHAPTLLSEMVDSIARLRDQGLDLIED